MNLEIDKDINLNLDKEKNVFKNIIGDVIDKASNYVIKMLPVPEGVRDVLKDVKEAIKTKDLKQVITTAVNSSLREGMEILGFDDKQIKEISNMKEALLKGGLRQALNAGIETSYSKYINGNLLGNEIDTLKAGIINTINGQKFTNVLDDKISAINACNNALESLCNKWNTAYNDFNLANLNKINLQIKSIKSNNYINDIIENRIKSIDNMTKMINSKSAKLTSLEKELCQTI